MANDKNNPSLLDSPNLQGVDVNAVLRQANVGTSFNEINQAINSIASNGVEEFLRKSNQGYNSTSKSSPVEMGNISREKQAAVDQVSQLKQLAQNNASNKAITSLDPTQERLKDLNTMNLPEYQNKYGRNAFTSREFAVNTLRSKVLPQVALEKEQELIDSASAGDVVVDASLAALAGGVNMIGGGAGLGLAVASNPLGAVTQGVETVGDLAAAFVGDDTNYEELIIGEQGDTRSDGIFAEAAENVEQFLAEQGEPSERELDVLQVESAVDKLPSILQDAAGKVFEGTKVVSDWIKSGQSDSLKARNVKRARENDEYVQKLKQELGDDAGWVDNAQKNTQILGNAFFNLASDPIAGLTVMAESVSTLLGAGSIAKQISNKSLDKAIKQKSQAIIDEVKAKDLPHNVTQELIKANLKAIKTPTTGAINVNNAAAVASGVLEGGGAATEAYNLIADTDFETLDKVSKRYRELVLKEGMLPEEARKALAIEASMGAGVAVAGLAGGITKLSGADKGINKAYGTVKTADGFIPRGVEIAKDAIKEGIEETFQSFISSAATGTIKKENVDPNTDIGAEAAIAAGEGALAGVGTSASLSGVRTAAEAASKFSESVNSAAKGTKKKLEKSASTQRKAKAIKESGVKESDIDVTSDNFDFTATVRGLAARNVKEGISEEEIETNISSAHTLVEDYLNEVDRMQSLIDNKELNAEQEADTAKAVEKALDDITEAYNYIDAMEQRTLDPVTITKDIEEASKGNTDAATRSMNNMAHSPSTVSAEQAQALIDSGSLTPEQTKQAEAHVQVQQDAKTLDEVHSDVMIGGKGFIGIKQYLDSIGSAIRAGKELNADKSYQGLKKFATRHAEKAQDYSEALFLVQQPNKTSQQLSRIRELNSKYPNADPKKDTFHNGSGRSQKFIDTVDKIGFEANALANAVTLAEINLGLTQEAPTETSTETEASVPVEQTEAVEEVTEAPVEEESITEPEVVTDTTDAVADNPSQQDLPPWDTTEETPPSNSNEPVKSSKPVKSEKSLPHFTRKDKKGNTYTYYENTETKDGVEVTSFTFNKSNKNKDARNKASLDSNIIFNEKGYEVDPDSIPDDMEVTKVYEIRKKGNKISATVKMENKSEENWLEADVILIEVKQKKDTKDLFNSALENLLDITDQVLNNEQVTEPEVTTETITPTPTVEIQDEANAPTEYVGSATKEARYKEFLSENHVAKYMVRYLREGKTQNPLSEIGNFISELAAKPAEYIKRYTTLEEVTPKQVELTRLLEDHHKDFSRIVNDILSTKAHTNKDMVQHYVKEDGTLDPELVEAMSIASYNWLATAAGGTVFNNKADIRRILGLGKEDIVPAEALIHLSTGTLRSTMSSNMGKDVLKIMQLKSNKEIAPGNFQGQVQNSIGLLTVATLLAQGMVNVEKVPNTIRLKGKARERYEELVRLYGDNVQELEGSKNKDVKELIKLLKAKSVKVTARTVKLPDEDYPTLHPVLQNITESVKETGSVLTKLFSVEPKDTGPTFSPSNKVTAKVRGSNQDVSKEDQDTIRNHQQMKHYIKHAQMDNLKSLSKEGLRSILGYRHDMDRVQLNRKNSVNSSNRGINKSINTLFDFIEGYDGTSPFFFTHDMVKNNRLLLVSNTLNPQTDKLHRHMVKIQNQDATIDFTSNDPTDENNFLIAFGQSMGIDIDKMLNDDSLIEVRKLMETKLVKEAVNAINSKDGDFTSEQEAAILAAVKKGGEKAWSFDGLVGLAGYLKAKENGETSFTHDLMVEADGITNGPAIGTIQFGIGNSISDIVERLKKVGINPKGDTQEFGDYISQAGSRDNYETITLELNKKLATMNAKDKKYADFALLLMGDLIKLNEETGDIEKINRNISKNPLMTTIYGAGKKSIKNKMGYILIEEFYKYLEENAGPTPEELQGKSPKEVDEINEFYKDKLRKIYSAYTKTFGVKLDVSLGTKPLEFTLPTQAVTRAKNLVGESLGGAKVDAIDEQYGQFKDGTRILNKGMGVVAETFQKIFEHARSKREQELAAQGVLAVSPQGNLLETLPFKEEKAILESLVNSQPIMHSVMSATTGNVNEGLFVGKTRNAAYGDDAYLTRQSYNKMPLYKEARMYGERTEYISGGVSPVVIAVQNIDATSMLRHLKEKRSFNVYDAIITGVRYISENTQNMNKHFYEINRDHSIATEAQKAYQRAEEAAKAYDAANGTDFAKEFLKMGTEYVDGQQYSYSIKDRLNQEVSKTNRNKETVLSTIGQVGQYGWENSSYVLNNATINLIDAGLDSRNDEDVITKSLGNTPLGDQGEFKTEAQRIVDSMTAIEIFDELGKMGNVTETTEHSAYLRESVNELKAQLLNPVKLSITNVLSDTMANVEGNDIYMYTQMFGGNKNSSAILNSGLRMSAQEAYSHELWHTVSRHGIEGNSKAKKELTRRWEQAKNASTPRDLMDDSTLPETSLEYQEAQKVWDYIFTPRVDLEEVVTNPITGQVQKKSYSNHLHEFAAYARTNAKMIELLKKVDVNTKTDEPVRIDDGSFLNSLYNKVINLLARVVDALTVQLTNTKGLPTDQAVQELVKQLSNIEGREKNLILNAMDKFNSTTDKLTGIVGGVAKQVVRPINAIAESKFVRDNKSLVIRLPGRLVRIANDSEKASLIIDSMKTTKRNLESKKQGFAGQLYTEAKGLTENFKNFHSLSRLKTKMVDGAVVELQSNLIKILNKEFTKTPPTDADKVALTKAYLKTDLSSLDLPMSELIKLLENHKKVNADIATLESRLKADPNFNHYLVQTKALGYFMATGKVTSSNLNYNAKQISQLFGTDKTNPNAARVERIIDMLATLYAVKYTHSSHKNTLAEFIKKNEATGTENGMTFFQALHRKQKEDDLKDVFSGSEVNVTKGYTKDDYDPNISAIILGDEEGLEYEKRGWVRTELMQDQADPANPVALYVDTHGGETRTIGSIISFTSKQKRGTDTIKRRQVLGSAAPIYEGGRDTAVIFAKKDRDFKAEVANAATFDPTKAETGMAPVYDLKGNITGYRYLMSEQTKDSVLKKSNDGISVFSKGAASTLNKSRSTEFNKKTIEALKQHFDSNKGGNFLSVGPDSKDPELKEIYARLPQDTKQAIKDIWGKDTMSVDRELLTMIFGYRKYSLADELAKDKLNQSAAIQFLGSVNAILGKPWNYSAEQVARSTGTYWQEYVSAVKDFLIIKSGLVTIINTISNSTQLYTAGLSIPKTLAYQKEAVVEVAKYREQMAELFELEKMVELGVQPNQKAKQEARIARLKAEITANPVTDVIEDGLLQNIVEDVNLVEDEFTRAGKLSQALDKHVFTKVPGYVREVAKEVTQSHDSFLYKKMSQSAQLSDFMARYALYKHRIEKGDARDDAANTAISTFINYDLPTHRGIQYLNDMGFLWFTKYYIGIQKIIAKTLIDAPARVISLVTLDFMTGDAISTVQDTVISYDNAMNRVGLVATPDEILGNLIVAQAL